MLLVRSVAIFLQIVDVCGITKFSQNLKIRLAFFDRLINENGLSIKHFLFQFCARIGSGVMAQNNSLISLVNLRFSKHFNQKWRPVYQEYSWELRNSVPNVGWDCLNRCYDNNILLLALEILSS